MLKCNRLAVHFRLTVDIFVVLYKYLNCAADKVIDAGHTAITDCNCQLQSNTISVTYYFLVQALMCTYAIWLKPSFAK